MAMKRMELNAVTGKKSAKEAIGKKSKEEIKYGLQKYEIINYINGLFIFVFKLVG